MSDEIIKVLKPTNPITQAKINPDQFAVLDGDFEYNNTFASSILNPYANFNDYNQTQSLVDSLAAEQVQMTGVKLFYIERTLVDLDQLFGEDPKNEFKKAYQYAAYLNQYDGFSGQNSFFNKFGLTANDEMTLTINPSLFANQCNGLYPKEGDLTILPSDQSIWEVTWVDKKIPLYQLGTSALVQMTLSKFIYSGENIDLTLQDTNTTNIMYDLDLNELTSLDNNPEENLNLADNLTGLVNSTSDQFAEFDQITTEGKEFIVNIDPINGSTPYKLGNKSIWFGDDD